MGFSLLPADPLKVVHLCRNYRRTNELQTIKLRSLSTALVVLDEQLNVLHVLELDKAQIHQSGSVQVLWFQTERDYQFIFWNLSTSTFRLNSH